MNESIKIKWLSQKSTTDNNYIISIKNNAPVGVINITIDDCDEINHMAKALNSFLEMTELYGEGDYILRINHKAAIDFMIDNEIYMTLIQG